MATEADALAELEIALGIGGKDRFAISRLWEQAEEPQTTSSRNENIFPDGVPMRVYSKADRRELAKKLLATCDGENTEDKTEKETDK